MTRHNQRTAYGNALVALGAANPDVVVLEADLGKSTMSGLFQQAYPERYFEMGIAEANMISVAAGLAAAGKIPFCSSFAVFAAGRPYDQIRQTVSIGRLNVNICGSSAGLSDFGDGATHQAVEDIAIMRAIPGMTVFTPADSNEVAACVNAAASIAGPVYIRVTRNDVPDLTDGGFVPGRMSVLREGSDVALLAHGVMLETAMDAASQLETRGISAKVVNVSTMKPFDEEGLRKIAESVRGIVTAEDHSVIGGLADAAAFALRGMAVPFEYVAIEDRFGQSARSAAELMEYYGLTAEAIVKKAKAVSDRGAK
jgi:transketolase